MLDPQAESYLDLLASLSTSCIHCKFRRRGLPTRGRDITQPEPPRVAAHVRVSNLSATGPGGEIPLRAYRPQGSDATQVLPVLVFLHGGGWTIGGLDTHNVACREICNRRPPQ